MSKRLTEENRIVMRKENSWKAVKLNAAYALKRQGYCAIAVADDKVKAQQMILGMRTSELVDGLLGRLGENEKLIVKTEIAQMAADFYEGMRAEWKKR